MTSEVVQPKIILVIGPTGTGKTSFINSVSGSQFLVPVNNSLDSCTNDVKSTEAFELAGHSVVLVDTPGLGHSHYSSDTKVLHEISNFLDTECKAGKALGGVIYMHPVPEKRIERSAPGYFKIFRELCEYYALNHIVVVVMKWGDCDEVRVPKFPGAEIFEDNNPYGHAKEIVLSLLRKQAIHPPREIDKKRLRPKWSREPVLEDEESRWKAFFRSFRDKLLP